MFAKNEGLSRMSDIIPIRYYLENICSKNVPTVYQNETSLFLYQFTKTFFENFILAAQDRPTSK
jgi:hypothetical protein